MFIVTEEETIHTNGHVEKKLSGDVTVTERRGQVGGYFQGTIYYMNIETGERSEVIRGQLTSTLSYRDQ